MQMQREENDCLLKLSSNPEKQRRKRGVILTPEGFKKLQAAKVEAESCEKSDKRYTLEDLSRRTGLDPDTLMKVFACEVGVDKRTLNRCFKAFNLLLEPSDYSLPSSQHFTLKSDLLETADAIISLVIQYLLNSRNLETILQEYAPQTELLKQNPSLFGDICNLLEKQLNQYTSCRSRKE